MKLTSCVCVCVCVFVCVFFPIYFGGSPTDQGETCPSLCSVFRGLHFAAYFFVSILTKQGHTFIHVGNRQKITRRGEAGQDRTGQDRTGQDRIPDNEGEPKQLQDTSRETRRKIVNPSAGLGFVCLARTSRRPIHA